MQRKSSHSTPIPAAKPADAPRGPTPIDPRDFKLVSGGLPKGGWTCGTLSTVSLPKGGW